MRGVVKGRMRYLEGCGVMEWWDATERCDVWRRYGGRKGCVSEKWWSGKVWSEECRGVGLPCKKM
jgi:hypothetical protein